MMKRHYTKLDKICQQFDQVLRSATTSTRPYPAQDLPEAQLTPAERKHTAGLMRVNHAGEVAAQALYHAQALVSRNANMKHQMQAAAYEEGDHLAWCQQRLIELNSHASYLNPIWYAGSFAIGLAAGLVGDKWSLGFVAETEQQVVQHLATHLQQLPANDRKTRHILQQMQADEAQHRDDAIQAGSKVLPTPIKKLMSLTARIMVKTAYWF